MAENYYEAFLGAYNQGQQTSIEKAKLAAQQVFQTQQLQAQQQQQSFDNKAEQQRITIAQQQADLSASHNKALENTAQTKALADAQKEAWKEKYQQQQLDQKQLANDRNWSKGKMTAWDTVYNHEVSLNTPPDVARQRADAAANQFDLGAGLQALQGINMAFKGEASPLTTAKVNNLNAQTGLITSNTSVSDARADNIKQATIIAKIKTGYTKELMANQVKEIISRTALNDQRKQELTLEGAKIQAETAKIHAQTEKTRDEIEIDKNLTSLKGDGLSLYMANNRKGIGDVQEKLRKGATEASKAVNEVALKMKNIDTQIRVYDKQTDQYNLMRKAVPNKGNTGTFNNAPITNQYVVDGTNAAQAAREKLGQERLLLETQQKFLLDAADDASKRYNALITKVYGVPLRDTGKPQTRVTTPNGGYDKRATQAASRAAEDASKKGAPGLPKIAPPPAARIHQNKPFLRPGKPVKTHTFNKGNSAVTVEQIN